MQVEVVVGTWERDVCFAAVGGLRWLLGRHDGLARGDKIR